MKNLLAAQRVLFVAVALALVARGAQAPGQQQAPAPAHHHHAHSQAEAEPAPPVKAKAPVIPDVEVLDQDNHQLHFYRDLVQGKSVAINFIFTTCTTICPPLTANFAKIQKTMRERGVKDFHLISVTVDPLNDTPERLKNYAALFHAQPGWTFVTGSRADLEQIWKAFNIYLSSSQDHPPTVAIGNDSRHLWAYASGLVSSEKLLSAIEPVIAGEPEKNADSGDTQTHVGHSR